MEKNNKENLKSELLSGIGELAKESDSDIFFQSLCDLMESEEYNEISDTIAKSDLSYKMAAREYEERLAEKNDIYITGNDLSQNDEEDDYSVITEENIGNLSIESEIEASEEPVYDEQTTGDIGEAPVYDEQTTGDIGESTDNHDELPDKNPVKKKKNLIYNIILVVSLAVFAYCAYSLGDYFYKHYQYKKGMNKLQEIVGDISANTNNIQVTPAAPKIELKYPDEVVYVKSEAENFSTEISDNWAKTYANLVELNPDCAGWLKIPGTRIDYPVMYTPNQHNKYLYKDFEGKYLYRGLPYMAKGTLLNRSQNYIIYGHHMQDGTAFHDLVYFLRRDFCNNNKYAYMNTGTTEGKYELFAVVESKIFNVDDKCFKFYNYTGELSKQDFDTYVKYMKKLSYYKSDSTAVYGDQLITLVTCYRVNDPEGRLCVVFKRIQ